MISTARVNLGCGQFSVPGWCNVDVHDGDDRAPDIVADVRSVLPVFAEAPRWLYAGHVLEHVLYDDVVATLNLWHRYAAPDATLMVVGPDCDRGREWLADGRMTAAEFARLGIHHAPQPGRSHLWECTQARLLRLVAASRWTGATALPIAAVGTDWPVVSRVGWQCAIRATAS